MSERPFDVLDKAKGNRVIIKIKPYGAQKKGKQVTGTLKAFDSHLNIWLTDASLEDQDSKTQFGKFLVRGSSVVGISPRIER